MSKRTFAVASFLALALPVSAQENKGTGHCHFEQTTTTKTTYSTSAIKVVYTVFGLFGSTQKCKTTHTTSTKYTYCGPPLKKVVKPIGHGPEESASGPTVGPGTGRPTVAGNIEYELRLLDGTAPCYGDPIAPDLEAATGRVRFIGLDGQVQDLAYTPASGTLSWFLGSSFDPGAFDPAYLSSAGWSGHVATVKQSMLVEPTLTWLAGGDPDVPVTALMDLDAPDMKVLHVDLGTANAGTSLVVVISATAPGDAPLLVVDGVTVPIVPDAYTTAFATTFPGFAGVADANGQADLGFPALAMPALEGVDLNVAVIAFDALGTAVDATTFTNLLLRDLDVCR